MSLHRHVPRGYHRTLGPHEPALSIESGDSVLTSTVDASGFDADGTSRALGPNPQTGPYFVRGAEPGDVLVIRFDRLWPNRDLGYSTTSLAPHVVDPEAVKTLAAPGRAEWRVDRAQGTAALVSPRTRLGALVLPIRPMLGCFGVAPDGGQAIGADTAGSHGGNMDYRGFVEGVTVYLPIFVPGALFSLGDGHAVQGDGELLGTGIEISFDVQFTASVLKQKHIGWPRAEDDATIMTIGSGRPLDQAAQRATTEMLRWLETEYRLDPVAASLLLGTCLEYQIGNVYDPAYTVVCRLAKALLVSFGGD